MELTERYSERMGKPTWDLEDGVSWIMFSVKAAATFYCAYRLQVWWIKSTREELGEH